jgi:cysteine desulfurase/selenocysteine lyase
MGAYDVAVLRAAEYPTWTGDAAFLNAASFGPMPERCRVAIEWFNQAHTDAFSASDYDVHEGLRLSRAALAKLIGADPAHIALTPNTNAGINLGADLALQRARAHPRGPRVIVLSDREFPANVYPWLALEHQGFTTEIIPTDERGHPREDALLERIAGGDVAVCALSAVQFASGYRADLARFGSACRENGVLFVVDAIQMIGAVPIDVSELDIDVLAAGCQKWLCAPWGTGFTYLSREMLEMQPTLPGWLSFVSSEDYTQLTQYGPELYADGRRFEVGTLPFQDFLGVARATELFLELGNANIWEHILTLQQPLLDWSDMRETVNITSSLEEAHRSGIICVCPPDPARAYDALTRAGIVCALREGSIRLSPHFYNTIEDMERVVAVLDEVVGA